MPLKLTPDTPLSLPMQRYVDEYLANPTGTYTSAALRAGYNPKSAANTAAQNNRDPRVRKQIEDGLKQQAGGKFGITRDRILQELCLVAFANLKDNISVSPEGRITILPDTPTEVSIETNTKTGHATQKIKTVKLADKVAALVQIGKHLGMFKDQLEVSGKVSLVDLVTASFADEITDQSNIIDSTATEINPTLEVNIEELP